MKFIEKDENVEQQDNEREPWDGFFDYHEDTNNGGNKNTNNSEDGED